MGIITFDNIEIRDDIITNVDEKIDSLKHQSSRSISGRIGAVYSSATTVTEYESSSTLHDKRAIVNGIGRFYKGDKIVMSDTLYQFSLKWLNSSDSSQQTSSWVREHEFTDNAYGVLINIRKNNGADDISESDLATALHALRFYTSEDDYYSRHFDIHDFEMPAATHYTATAGTTSKQFDAKNNAVMGIMSDKMLYVEAIDNLTDRAGTIKPYILPYIKDLNGAYQIIARHEEQTSFVIPATEEFGFNFKICCDGIIVNARESILKKLRVTPCNPSNGLFRKVDVSNFTLTPDLVFKPVTGLTAAGSSPMKYFILDQEITGCVEFYSVFDAYVLLYHNGVYVGKITPSGNVVDKVENNVGGRAAFGYFNHCNLTDIMAKYDVDSIRLGFKMSDVFLNNGQEDWESYIAGLDVSDILTAYTYDYKNGGAPERYSFGSDLVKRPINAPTFIGKLNYHQSFCIYDNTIISTNGSIVEVMDMSFNSVSTHEMDLGHGNSMQLAEDSKLYVSGWDDGKIHVVDPSTITELTPITLPSNITGYTTGVVDTVNKLAYILQRDTYPTSQTNYNLITYDYDNDEIVSTKKIVKSFAALQSCDFYDGKIVVMYGIHRDYAPSGCFVCDTNGNILTEIVMPEIYNTEPEGVFIDKQNHVLYFGDTNNNVYRLDW